MPARTAETPRRWLALGLSIHVLAAVLVLPRVLSPRAERRAPAAAETGALARATETEPPAPPALPAVSRD